MLGFFNIYLPFYEALDASFLSKQLNDVLVSYLLM
jgi:hypothetical protein